LIKQTTSDLAAIFQCFILDSYLNKLYDAMDPLSLTASIITVVGLASQTSKALRSLYNLRHAPREMLELANEVIEQPSCGNIADALSRSVSCKLSFLWFRKRPTTSPKMLSL
jgi:hypothetical protein